MKSSKPLAKNLKYEALINAQKAIY